MQPLASSASSSSSSSSSPVFSRLKKDMQSQVSFQRNPLFVVDAIGTEIISYLSFPEMALLTTTCKKILHLYKLQLSDPLYSIPLTTEAIRQELRIPEPLKLQLRIKQVLTDSEIHEFNRGKIPLIEITRLCISLRGFSIDFKHDYSTIDLLTPFTSLTTLKISNAFGKFDFTQLPQNLTLTHLHISGRVKIATLSTFCPKLKHLIWEDLSCSDNKINNKNLIHLNNFIDLEHLELIGCMKINNIGLEKLKIHTKLIELRLFGCGLIDNNGLKTISEFKHLERLSLLGLKKINNEGITELQTLTQLKRLELIACSETINVGPLQSINPLLTVHVEVAPENPNYVKLISKTRCHCR